MGAATDKDFLARAVHNPGRLVLGPTATSGAFPYGGVPLGFHVDAEVVWQAEYFQTRDPLSGRVVEIGRDGAEYPEIYCLIDGPNWDEDALLGIFNRATRPADLTYTAPAETRIEGTTIPTNVRPWPPILMVSEDPTLKSWYMRRPLPTLSLRQSCALARDKRCGLPIRLIPSPDSAYATTPDWQCARLENITL